MLLVVTLFFILSNFYFLADYKVKDANAQGAQVVADPSQLAVQIPWKAAEITRFSTEEILNDLKATFFKNVVANLARTFAKSFAQYIVTGNNGGKPFWETNIWESIKNQGQAAFEDWLTAAISNGIGLDLCKFDPTLTLNIALLLPNKSDKLAKDRGIMGNQGASGCSFEDLKDKFSNDSPEWQDYVKIKATEIGPDFRQTIDQLSRDIRNNKNLTVSSYTAQTFFHSPVGQNEVLLDLTRKTNELGDFRNKLDADITLMMDNRGSQNDVPLSIGSRRVAPENINEIKSTWQKKIVSGRSNANTQKTRYRSCYNKTITTIRTGTCAEILKELGYGSAPGDTWVTANPALAQEFVREVQDKLQSAYNFYNSLSNGYEGLYKFINNQIKPEMFETGGLYTYQKAKTQFEPQADPAAETTKQVEKGSTSAQTNAEERQKTEVNAGSGWKGSVEKISKYIKTPASIMEASTIESLTPKDSVMTYTKSIVADSLGIFLQELYNLYMQQLIMALSNPKKQKSSDDGNTFNAKKQSMVTEEGVNLYYENLSPETIVTLPDLDLLQEFQTTISNKKINPNIYNNVIDLNFAMAIEQRMTIGEAINSNKLNGNSGFSWSETQAPNTYNLSNLRKLRKARIVPLGLELAAELIRDCNFRNILDDWGNDGLPDYANFEDLPGGYYQPDIKPYDTQRMQNCLFKPGDYKVLNTDLKNAVINATLKDVVDGFSKRGDDGNCGTFDVNESPFCNLVDPEWVLKIPATKCLQTSGNEAPGEILQDNTSGTRYGRCADFVSCLTDDNVKNCASGDYGVCVKEKNVWRLGGDTCDQQYDSCRNYTTTDNQNKKSQVSFLKNTLDPAGCGPDNIGCKGYTRIFDSPYKIYFNKNVEKCEDKAEGCHEFITDPIILTSYPTLPTVYDDNVLASRVYYKINPACDVNPAGANCSNFMSKCLASEVGCALYKPVSPAPDVTAVLHIEDQCPAECNGFSAFFRQPTSFEPEPAIAYFVPTPVKTCKAASVGCSEFTNLEKINTGTPVAEALEYYTSLRQCIKPGTEGKTDKTFFTWQSISTGPQQVIKHVLQSITTNADLAAYPAGVGEIGAPATYDHSGVCNPITNNYCLNFYDSAGHTYYRDIRKTIIVSATACYPLRKTNSDLTTCPQTNGNWDPTNNYCTYNAYVPTAAEAATAGFGEKSQTCTAAENGCYNYLGASGHNIYNVFRDDFESGLPAAYGSTSDLSIFSEAPTETNHSLKINRGASAVRTVEITGGKYYVLEFLAKGPGSVAVAGFGTVTLASTWENITLGPVKIDSTLYNLAFDNLAGNAIYLDNIKLVQNRASYYLIENSWPQVACGIEDLNCEAYSGPNEQTFYIKQFPNLCGADKVGCQYLLDTQNSVNPQSQNFSGVIVPADNRVSYVVNSKFKCTIEARGCEKFSEPTYQTGTGIVNDNVILKNDPEAYLGVRSILCSSDADGCTELINESGYPEYYKIDPAKICEYNASGWYLNGPEETTSCSGADPLNITAGQGYIGACPQIAGNCTGFKTINRIQEPAVTYGATYYLIDNEDNIDRKSCVAGTDWTKGCVAFKNTVNNDVQTIKVTKDRDCAEWVDCAEKDNVGNCIKTVSNISDETGTTASVAKNYCSMQNASSCDLTFCAWNSATSICGSKNSLSVANSSKDKVRYDAVTGDPEIINRKTYVLRFANASEIWDKGDYSGYTIPDRYPLEMELAKAFGTYAIETVTNPDTRFAAPVCKVFPSEDAPIPGEIINKSAYAKILNVYSQSVNQNEVADACNYETVEAQGVTTYFPFGYLKAVSGDISPKICTGMNVVNGKLCTGREKNNADCKTSSDETDIVDVVQTNAYGKCSGIESVKTNFGLQGRCLEMDILNPIYGNIKPGSYACLSYFPFQYDECYAVSDDQAKCKKLPYCTWLAPEPAKGSKPAVVGKCVSDICRFYKDQDSCDGVAGDPTKCIWDGAQQKCLFRRCSLTDVTSKAECTNLATYCKWYGNSCVEDICSPPYADLAGHYSSHDETKTDLCMNPAAAPSPVPSGYGLSTVPGNGAYCAWQMKGPVDKGRYTFSCNLKCEIKYPADAESTQMANCKADAFCKWSGPQCKDYCAVKNMGTCQADARCAWSYIKGDCIDKCSGYDESSVFTACQNDTDCKLSATCVDDGINVCTGLDGDACSSLQAICSYTGGVCKKNATFNCDINSTVTPFRERTPSECLAITGCKLADQVCAPAVASSCSGKSSTACTGDCAWGGGECVTQLNTRDCDVHIYSEGATDNDTGQLCRANANCRWTYYDWSNYNFCFPKDCTNFTLLGAARCTGFGNTDCEWVNNACRSKDGNNYNSMFKCHMCVPAAGYNVCDGGMCN